MGVDALGGRSLGPVSDELGEVVDSWARGQYRLVVLSAEFEASDEWIMAGSPTAAHWLADLADVEVCTAREWIRIGRCLGVLPAIAEAFESQRISYSKVRALTRLATPENEAELLEIGLGVPAGQLSRALAAWFGRNTDPDDLAAHQRRQRRVSWRTEPDGMVTFTLKLTPVVAGMLIAFLTSWVMKCRPRFTQRGGGASAEAWPTVAQQYADAVEDLVSSRGEPGEGPGAAVGAEIVLHVRGDGCSLDDGTPVGDSAVASLIGESFIRVLIHDAETGELNASGRQRHPTLRQKRVVKERDRVCVDCGRADLLVYDHVPSYAETGRTIVDELELRCGPCHRLRHGEPT